MIELFSANTPNGKKISIMLEEIGYEYKVTKIDLDNGEQFKQDFKKISPFSKIPVIIDHKNNNGWIHISQLKSPKSLIVLENKTLFKKNSIFSKPIIKLEKGKLVLIKKCKENWCKIKTNKITGWLRTENVWGIN